jgi:hypothetical protein
MVNFFSRYNLLSQERGIIPPKLPDNNWHDKENRAPPATSSRALQRRNLLPTQEIRPLNRCESDNGGHKTTIQQHLQKVASKNIACQTTPPFTSSVWTQTEVVSSPPQTVNKQIVKKTSVRTRSVGVCVDLISEQKKLAGTQQKTISTQTPVNTYKYLDKDSKIKPLCREDLQEFSSDPIISQLLQRRELLLRTLRSISSPRQTNNISLTSMTM